MVAASALILANGAPPAPTLEDAGLAVDGASTAALGAARLAFALTHLGVLLALCLGPGVVVTTDFYKPELGSQLRVRALALWQPDIGSGREKLCFWATTPPGDWRTHLFLKLV